MSAPQSNTTLIISTHLQITGLRERLQDSDDAVEDANFSSDVCNDQITSWVIPTAIFCVKIDEFYQGVQRNGVALERACANGGAQAAQLWLRDEVQ